MGLVFLGSYTTLIQRGRLVHNIFNINLIKLGQSDVKGNVFYPFEFGLEYYLLKPQGRVM